jgi:hypothetical protein
MIVECKTTMGVAVLAQAVRNVARAHYVVVAVPVSGRSAGIEAVLCVLDAHGIGWLETNGVNTRWKKEPRLYRKAATTWTKRLCPEQQVIAEPGSCGGGYWTPYRATCERVREYVTQHPGASTKDVIASIKHHYRSDTTAKSCLPQWAAQHRIPGVRVERDGKNWTWFPAVASMP